MLHQVMVQHIHNLALILIIYYYGSIMFSDSFK